MEKANNTDEYLAGFSGETRKQLEEIRAIIKTAAPEAKEVISYGMPAFKMNSVIVYFAGYANHIGFYPTGTGIAAFQNEISGYKNSKGAVQFPIDKPLPKELITKMVHFKIEEDRAKALAKKK